MQSSFGTFLLGGPGVLDPMDEFGDDEHEAAARQAGMTVAPTTGGTTWAATVAPRIASAIADRIRDHQGVTVDREAARRSVVGGPGGRSEVGSSTGRTWVKGRRTIRPSLPGTGANSERFARSIGVSADSSALRP